ncbi:hypothetical protein N7462_001046 [Penicillium macrosclerotiorum]|uniref:uncharacterized protein n=1 Tax=Penicillium macrosclerotiorum TaxID=303699 RepID=UPI0025492A46|nr:uncharacterized protein N7462_001046 [Penicillium macrosclerotiorum]KAJ5699041.1 hypothetical protein N7462_001046 [Penicillium macrosclerotiorum]
MPKSNSLRHSSDSSRPTSASTQQTSVSSRQSDRQQGRTANLLADVDNLEVAGPPKLMLETKSIRRVTRSMTGSLKRKVSAPSEIAPTSPQRKKIQKQGKSATKDSPWDPTPRGILNFEDLDLDKSYVGDYKIEELPQPKRYPRQKRWKWDGDEPLTDLARLRALYPDWNSSEPDLAESSDFDGQISRCHERIEDNIMPHIFEQKLYQYEKSLARRQELIKRVKAPPHSSWDVVERIDRLHQIQEEIEKQGDGYEQIPNVRSILTAYQSGELDWTGLVTYWSHGNQISQPRPFDWDEFEAINKKYEGSKSFWVEGTHQYNGAFRLPGYGDWAELEVTHDTGAGLMMIYKSDLMRITGACRPPQYPGIRIIGASQILTAGEQILVQPVIQIEVTILDADNKRMSQWTRTACIIKDFDYDPEYSMRLDGPWLRHMLYTGSARNNHHNRLYVSTSKAALRLPNIPKNKRRPPSFPDLVSVTPAIIDIEVPDFATRVLTPRPFPKAAKNVVDYVPKAERHS